MNLQILKTSLSNFLKSKNLLYYVILILVSVGGFFQWRACTNLKTDKIEFSLLDKQSELQIKKLNKDVKKWLDASIESEKKADSFSKSSAKWYNAYLGSLDNIKKLTAKIEKMSADQIVKEFQTILGLNETEVWLNSLGIIFSDFGSRVNLKAVTTWKEYETKTIPDLNKSIKDQQDANLSLKNSITEKNNALTKKDEIHTTDQSTIDRKNNLISDYQKAAKWATVREVGLVIVAVLIKLFWK